MGKIFHMLFVKYSKTTHIPHRVTANTKTSYLIKCRGAEL